MTRLQKTHSCGNLQRLVVDTNAAMTRADVRAILTRSVNPRETGLRVTRLCEVRGVVAVEALNDVTQDRLLGCPALAATRLVASVPARRLPQMLIFDVPAYILWCELVEEIIACNLATEAEGNMVSEGLTQEFQEGPCGKSLTNWIVETTPEVRFWLLRVGQLSINWRLYRVVNYIQVTRCYKCQKYGHVAKPCKSDNKVCKHPGYTRHNFPACLYKSTLLKCANCRLGCRDHPEDSAVYPSYKAALCGLIGCTTYFGGTGQPSHGSQDRAE